MLTLISSYDIPFLPSRLLCPYVHHAHVGVASDWHELFFCLPRWFVCVLSMCALDISTPELLNTDSALFFILSILSQLTRKIATAKGCVCISQIRKDFNSPKLCTFRTPTELTSEANVSRTVVSRRPLTAGSDKKERHGIYIVWFFRSKTHVHHFPGVETRIRNRFLKT